MFGKEIIFFSFHKNAKRHDMVKVCKINVKLTFASCLICDDFPAALWPMQQSLRGGAWRGPLGKGLTLNKTKSKKMKKF